MIIHMTRRQLLTTTLAGLACGSGLRARANTAQPLRMIVPSSPGSGLDTQLRAIAPSMTEVMGRTIVIENLAGAGGVIGTTQIVRAAPDGNTLGFISNNHVVNPTIYKNMPFDSLKDISPISVVSATPFLLVVNPKLPMRNLQEFQTLLSTNPGKYNYASSGNGTILHMAAAQMLEELGVQARHIPYRGVAPMVTDIIAGNCDFGILASSVVLPQVGSGTMRALATATPARLAAMPDVPTYAEQGFPTVDVNGWCAIIGPANMPHALLDKLHADIVATFTSPAAQAALAQQQVIVSPMSIAASTAYFATEMTRYAQLAKNAKLTMD